MQPEEIAENYKITIYDKHTIAGETSESKTELMGNLDLTKDGYTICYAEYAGDFAGTVTEIYVNEPGSVRMLRGGDFSTELILECGKRHNCCYETPYGSLLMGVYAHEINSAMENMGGDLTFSYSLDVGGGELSENELKINVRRAGEENRCQL